MDLDHGTYPYVTSSHPIAGGACVGAGVGPKQIGKIIGVVKAYSTRVGEGPFPTELLDETGDTIRERGREFGTVTGRPRRCGWMDLVALDYACMLNGVTQLVITKADVLDAFDELKICTSYKVNGKETNQIPFQMNHCTIEPQYQSFKGWNQDITAIRESAALPAAMKTYVDFINSRLGAKVHYISNGPGRDQIVAVQ